MGTLLQRPTSDSRLRHLHEKLRQEPPFTPCVGDMPNITHFIQPCEPVSVRAPNVSRIRCPKALVMRTCVGHTLTACARPSYDKSGETKRHPHSSAPPSPCHPSQNRKMQQLLSTLLLSTKDLTTTGSHSLFATATTMANHSSAHAAAGHSARKWLAVSLPTVALSR